MTEIAAEYSLATPDIGELQAMSAVTWERSALVFNSRLTENVINQLSGGLQKFSDGYQTYWGDFWAMLELSGYEWTDYVPESIAFNTASNWRRLVKRFPVDVRLSHKNLKASHYIEANHKKLTDEQATQLLDYADEHAWTVEMLRAAVKETIGAPERQPKPKVIQCPHCDNYTVESEAGCPWCMLRVAETRIESLRAVLTELASPSGDEHWAAGLAQRALDEI